MTERGRGMTKGVFLCNFIKNNPLFLFFENFVVDFFENKKSCQIEKIIFGGDFLLV